MSTGKEWITKFEGLCASDDLSIDKLRTMVEEITPQDYVPDGDLNILAGSSFLHKVCMNKNITLEIVEYLLNLYPTAMDKENSAFPLHLACCNKDCPNEVVELLLSSCINKIRNYLLKHICYMNDDWGDMGYGTNDYGGTPLHFYLSRTSNVDLNIVKELVNENAELIVSADEDTKCTPIHIIMNNKSIGDMFDVVRYLVETNPDSLLAKDSKYGHTPLHVACNNGHITTKTIKLLLQACPDSIHERNIYSSLPLHCLTDTVVQDDKVGIDILKLLLEAHPDSVSETEGYGHLPLHLAAYKKSSGFCKLLVDAYPESVRRGDGFGHLPLHNACDYGGRPDTVEYLSGLYPESLQIRNNGGYLPIHCAAGSPGDNTAEIVNVLLRHDPECLSKPFVSDSDDNGALPLHLVCSSQDKSNVTEHLFDLYPEAILLPNGRGELPIDVIRVKLEFRQSMNFSVDRETKLIPFLQTQMSYARKAQDQNVMMTPDHTGLLPLHHAIRYNAPLGSIKLLVKGNTYAINVPDGNGIHPFDLASQFSTVGVVKYLAELVPDRLNACDVNKSYPLHHACRGGNCEVIEYLLKTPISSASVSERNANDMLPIHLFCEFVNDQEEDDDSPKYTETIWRLLSAYPETILN